MMRHFNPSVLLTMLAVAVSACAPMMKNEPAKQAGFKLSDARQAHLAHPSLAASPTTLSVTSSVSTTSDPAIREWAKCLVHATDALLEQPEPARTVVDAALGSCNEYETAFTDAHGDDQALTRRIRSEAIIPDLLARIMTIRAARDRLQKAPPHRSSIYQRM